MKRTVEDVMTRTVVVVDDTASFKEVVRRMQDFRVSAVPVVDAGGHLVGLVSEGDLILKADLTLEGDPRLLESRHTRIERGKHAGVVASELMTKSVITVAPDASLGEAARLMHRHQIKRLPVVGRDERVLGIVSRVDLLKVFLRDDGEIAREIRDDVIRRTLWIDPDTIRVVVHDGVVTLEGQLERRSLVPVVLGLVHAVEGVVAVQDRLSYLEDDASPASGLPLPWTAISPGPGR